MRVCARACMCVLCMCYMYTQVHRTQFVCAYICVHIRMCVHALDLTLRGVAKGSSDGVDKPQAFI